jgi:hypothetical protein
MSGPMLALFVALIAIAFYHCVRLFGLVFGQIRQKPGGAPGTGLKNFLADEVGDGDCDLLWQTQLPALEFLKLAGARGVLARHLMNRYHELSQAYPELCDGSSFWDWLGVLEQEQAVVRKGKRIAITPRGLFVLDRLERKAAAREVRQRFEG